MTNPIFSLSLLSFLLLIGVVVSIIAKKIRLPDILLLLLIGLSIGHYTNIFSFDPTFLTSLAVFALIMIVFDSTSKFKLKELALFSGFSLKLAVIFFLLSLVILSLATHILFSQDVWQWQNLWISVIFGAMMGGNSPSVVLPLLQKMKTKIAEVLEFEAVISTPLIILVPFLVLEAFTGTVHAELFAVKFLQGIITGIGTGIVIGLAVFKLMKTKYEPMLSPIAVIATALVTYTLSELIGGNGVLAVTALGIVFGVMTIKEKVELERFSGIFTNFLKIVVFILIGLLLKIPLNTGFLIKSLILFAILIGIRYLSIKLSFMHHDLTRREKVFMTLTNSKGIGEAVMVFVLIGTGIAGLATITELALLFILYSIVMSSIVVRFADKLIIPRKDVLKKVEIQNKLDKKRIENYY